MKGRNGRAIIASYVGGAVAHSHYADQRLRAGIVSRGIQPLHPIASARILQSAVRSHRLRWRNTRTGPKLSRCYWGTDPKHWDRILPAMTRTK